MQLLAQRRGSHVALITLEMSSDVLASNVFRSLEDVLISGCCGVKVHGFLSVCCIMIVTSEPSRR